MSSDVMKVICRDCFAEISDDDIRQFDEVDMGHELCWPCAMRPSYGLDPIGPGESHGVDDSDYSRRG
jgi:hypothetical protein